MKGLVHAQEPKNSVLGLVPQSASLSTQKKNWEKTKTNMLETLKPAIGSNQHVTKFGEAKKRSYKLSKRTKVELVGIAIIAILATVNYYVIKANYVVTCAIKVGELTQSTAGHLMSKNTCNDIASDWMSARNYELDQYAKKQLINN